MTETFGPHLTFDASGCDKKKLTDQNFVYRFLNDMPGAIGMTRITLPYVVEWLDKWATTPGYTGFVILAESHISVHTFPDSSYVFVDIFSCREFDVDKAIDYLTEIFGAQNVTTNIIQRGIDFPRGQHIPHKMRVRA